MSPNFAPLDLLKRLVTIADKLVADRSLQISDNTLRSLRAEVDAARHHANPDWDMVDYQATCLAECITALAHARTDRDAIKEDRAKMYISTLAHFLHTDVIAHERSMRQ